MTNEEQIEYLATKVMGWEKGKEHRNMDGDIWQYWVSERDQELIYSTVPGLEMGSWNPLTDWNHWRQVESKIIENSKLSVFYVRELTECRGATVEGAIVHAMAPNLQQRVVAVISAHQSLDSN